ncbi:hypothetical protein Lal_00016634 [Lupinus albus]|nr:hypothetical protein Lal_00016634 [Lupinus albus]
MASWKRNLLNKNDEELFVGWGRGEDANNHNLNLISWDVITRQNSDDDLGIRDARIVNIYLLGKLHLSTPRGVLLTLVITSGVVSLYIWEAELSPFDDNWNFGILYTMIPPPVKDFIRNNYPLAIRMMKMDGFGRDMLQVFILKIYVIVGLSTMLRVLTRLLRFGGGCGALRIVGSLQPFGRDLASTSLLSQLIALFGVGSHFLVGLLAMEQGLNLTWNLGFRYIILGSDCFEVVHINLDGICICLDNILLYVPNVCARLSRTGRLL